MIAYLLPLLLTLTPVQQITSESSNTPYEPTEDNLFEREVFQDTHFGIFLHWGIYSMMAQGEWVMNNLNLNYQEYPKLAGGFYPASFDAEEWISAIEDAGAGYICFTTRHHDGFSMWDTHQSDYNIVDATPFKRDVLLKFLQVVFNKARKNGAPRLAIGNIPCIAYQPLDKSFCQTDPTYRTFKFKFIIRCTLHHFLDSSATTRIKLRLLAKRHNTVVFRRHTA